MKPPRLRCKDPFSACPESGYPRRGTAIDGIVSSRTTQWMNEWKSGRPVDDRKYGDDEMRELAKIDADGRLREREEIGRWAGNVILDDP